jgi:hypothetical protein
MLKKMAASGERRKAGDPDTSRGATSLKDLGIPRDRASRAMQLADVPKNVVMLDLTSRVSASVPSTQ